MRVAAHQPNYMPWLGFVKKASMCDVFVIADDDQYTKGSFIDYNFVKSKQGAVRLKVPVSGSFGSPICDMTTCDSTGWRRRHLKTLESCYGRARNFASVYEVIERRLLGNETSLSVLNTGIITDIFSLFGISPKIVMQSTLGITGKKEEGIIQICRAVGADTYVSGVGAKAYQREESFADAGITLEYAEYEPKPYKQMFGEFVPFMSSIDYLMNADLDDIELP